MAPSNPKYKVYKLITAAWTLGFVLTQAWLQYQHRGAQLFKGNFNRPELESILSSTGIILGIAWFLTAVAAVHAAFFWINVTSFNRLLAPRLPLERTRLLALLGQLLLTTLTLSLLNAWFYPRSLLGSRLDLLLTIPSGRIILVCLTIAVATYFFSAILPIIARSRIRTALLTLLLIGGTHSAIQFSIPAASAKRENTHQPDVIIIGVDSLRPDHLHRNGAPFQIAPNLERILNSSSIFTDTLSPQSHTFPATVSILTGQWPNRHGARANLFPENRINRSASIAHDFKEAGYTTIMGMDETRFANIDHHYGFDRLLGPPMGFLDFLMSAASDNVLVNLTVNSPAGRILFPLIHGNRAIDHVYSPRAFSHQVNQGIRGLSRNKPAFIYLHFCAGHWPYRRWSLYQREPEGGYLAGDYHDANPNYLRALADADKQVGEALTALGHHGRLDNAILVLLSDHGEDFNMSKDRLLGPAQQPSWSIVRGHGGSAIRAPQIQVLLAIKRFGGTPLPTRSFMYPASLVDVAPTLAELAALPEAMRDFDGISLAPLLADKDHSEEESPRVRFVESSFLPIALTKAEIDERQVLEEERGRYEITPSGHVRIREQFIEFHLENRERAVYQGGWGLGIPKDPSLEPIVLHRDTNQWWPLTSAPSAAPSKTLLSEACRHWDNDSVAALKSRCETEDATHDR